MKNWIALAEEAVGLLRKISKQLEVLQETQQYILEAELRAEYERAMSR